MRLVRLWVNGEDYGEMLERAAELYREEHMRRCPDEPIRIEPVMTPSTLPTHCNSCGAFLQGGATTHTDNCQFLALIRKHFPNYQQPE